jgi:hypothetical protein
MLIKGGRQHYDAVPHRNAAELLSALQVPQNPGPACISAILAMLLVHELTKWRGQAKLPVRLRATACSMVHFQPSEEPLWSWDCVTPCHL